MEDKYIFDTHTTEEIIQTVFDNLYKTLESELSKVVANGKGLPRLIGFRLITDKPGHFHITNAPPVDKNQLSELYQELAGHEGVQFAMLVMDAWAIKGDQKDYEEQKDSGLSLEFHPNRKQAVVASFLTPTKQAIGLVFYDEQGNVEPQEALIWSDKDKIEGRFIRKSDDTPTIH